MQRFKFPFLMLAVLVSSFLTLGCGSDQDEFVFTTNTTSVAPQGGLQLQISADPGALAQGVLGQFAPEVTQLQVTLFDSAVQQVGQETILRNGTATFENLVAGDYLVRMIGLNAGGDILGYFDKVVTVSDELTISTIPTLIPSSNPPAVVFPATDGSPAFVAFVEVPANIAASTPFSVSVQVFDASGNPVTTVLNGLTLSSSLGFEVAPSAQNTSAAGLATFDGLSFGPSATGATTFTVSASGLSDAVSFPSSVSAPPDFFASTEQVLAQGGGEPNGDEDLPSVSQDGRFVAFESSSSNLVSGDDEGFDDIFVLDRQSGTVERISQAANGDGGNSDSYEPSISADGRFVAFESDATNLATDSNNDTDIFVYDRQSGTMEIVSVNSNENQGGDDATSPSISGDGNLVAFQTSSDLAGAGTNGNDQIYLRNRSAGTTILVSKDNTNDNIAPDGAQSASVSSNGLFVAFRSNSNLVTGDSNSTRDIMVYDITNDVSEIVTRAADGTQANFGGTQPSISADGTWVSFTSGATNLLPGGTPNLESIYLKNRVTGEIFWASEKEEGGTPDSGSYSSSVSFDGRFVVFQSDASDIVPGNLNSNGGAVVFDRVNQSRMVVSVSSTGGDSDGYSDIPAISGDGTVIAFPSEATNLTSPSNASGSDYHLFVLPNPFRR